MHRLAIAAASLIAATALVGGCEQDSTTQPEPEVVATAAVPEPTPAPEPEPERTEYFTLLALCESGDATPERIQEFLDLRAEVNAKSKDGRTPLHEAAAYNENSKVLTVLIDAGADVKAKNYKWSSTPLHFAAEQQQPPGPDAPHQRRGRCECEELARGGRRSSKPPPTTRTPRFSRSSSRPGRM